MNRTRGSIMHGNKWASLVWLFAATATVSLSACGGGGGGGGTPTAISSSEPTPSPAPGPAPAPTPAPAGGWAYANEAPSRSGCAANEGVTYEVGAGKTYANPRDVPWQNLAACDQVLIHYRTQPYRDIIMLGARGASNKWIIVRGIPGPNGERPVFDGNNAVSPTDKGINQYVDGAGMFIIAKPTGGSFNYPALYKPGYLHIAGFKFQNVRPPALFTPAAGGAPRAWDRFVAGISAVPVENLAVTDNEFTGNSIGLFVNSVNGEYGQSSYLTVAGNYFHGNGIAGDAGLHNAYTEAVGTIYESNYFGPPVAGTAGDNIKERSAGLVMRYNYIEDGVNLIAMRDPESNYEFEAAQLDSLGERLVTKAFVYANILVAKSPTVYGESSIIVGYGDGQVYGTGAQVREGNLYFYSNKVVSWNDYRQYYTESVPLFAMLNVRAPTTVVARNNQFYTQRSSSTGTAAPFSIFYHQGVAEFQANWINKFQLTQASSGGDGLAVGTKFTGAGLGALAESSGDPGFANLALGDYASTPSSPFLALSAPLPDAILQRGLAPAAAPVQRPFGK
jgi:hypothetical protein